MSEPAPLLHETLRFERNLKRSPRAVFDAYRDVSTRARWSTPSDAEAIVYSSSDFRVGGADLYRCGPRDNLRFEGEVRYLDIIPTRRILYSEWVTSQGQPLAASLVTWELTSAPPGSHLHVTVQAASFVGEDMIAGIRSGTRAALDNLQNLIASE